MNLWRKSRAFLSLALALVGVWATMVTVAEAAVMPAIHCHSMPMPCCPANDSGAAHCMASQCFVQMPQKAETGLRTLVAQANGVSPMAERQLFPAPSRRLVRSATWQPEVFRLKDDSRI